VPLSSFQAFLKDPAEVLDYTMDWTDKLQPIGDTINTSSWTVPSGLTDSLETNTGLTATVWLASGVLSTTYQVDNTIVTTGGRTMKWSFLLQLVTK
jgi:hypothetical protein